MAKCYLALKEYSNADKCWVKFITDPSMPFVKPEDRTFNLWDFVKYMNDEGVRRHHTLQRKAESVLKKSQLHKNLSTSTEKEQKDYDVLESLYKGLPPEIIKSVLG